MGQSRKYGVFQSTRSLVLVGMMGAGKTTVGRRLAPLVGLPFHDADAEIEKAAGMSVSDLFQLHGERSFRDGEAKVIKRLLEGPPHVLATGGGAVTDPKTRELIAAHSVSIWIKADIETIMLRASRRGTRPLLKTGDPRQTIQRLLDERNRLYAEADIHVDSQPGPHANTVALIMEKLENYPGLLHRREGAKT